MTDVRLPDGTVVQNVPDGITQSDLMGRLQKAGHPAAASLTPAPKEPALPPTGAGGQTAPQAAPAKPGIMGQVGQAAMAVPRAAGAGLKDIGHEMMKEGTENAYDIKGDLTAPVQSHDKQGKPGKPGVLDYAARAGKTALDVASRPLVPISAAATSLIGRPGEELTGIKKERFGDVASMAVPFAPEIKAAMKSPQVIDGAKAFEKMLSPTTVSPESKGAEKIIRRAGGEHSLQAEKTASNLVEGNKVVANLPQDQQLKLIDYIENRSKVPGVKLKNTALQATADKIGKAMQDYRAKIGKVLPATANQQFIDDYFVHMWKDKPTVVKDKMGAFARQGSGRNLKARSIPTIADGIKAGLTPLTTNPIEATSMYAQNMSKFLATHDMQTELKTQGYAKWFSPGSKNVPKGWVPLKGILTEKVAPGSITKAGVPTGRPIKLYAHPDVARVYNRFISQGLEGTSAGPLFAGARHLANGLTMLKLGLSPFHLDTMANESVTSGFARAYKALSQGRLGTAAKAAGTAVARPGIDYMRGMKMQKELLEKAMPDAMSKKVNDAFVRSGGRLKMDPFYRTRASGSFFNAIEKGTFKSELKAAADRIYKGSPYEKVKGSVDLAANLIQSTAAPLFEKYIPAVKRGAFASAMEDWLKANPAATQDAIDNQAIKLSDSIDNRFGELVQDNLFWSRWAKQMAQIVLLSPTWDLGTIREIGGGLKDLPGGVADIAKGKGISDRTAYVAGLATEVALKNAIYTYMKTGTAPKGKDFMAGRTGGTDINSGKPERVITPGYEKDVYAFGYDFPHNILTESANKLNPFIQGVGGLATNRDYRGLPIYGMEGAPVPEGSPGLPDYLLEQLMPITLGQASKQVKKGSNIGSAERLLLADRPAPGYIQDPDRMQMLKERANRNLMHRRVKSDRRLQSEQQ